MFVLELVRVLANALTKGWSGASEHTEQRKRRGGSEEPDEHLVDDPELRHHCSGSASAPRDAVPDRADCSRAVQQGIKEQRDRTK